MNKSDRLIKGVAYHGNRILRHVESDMRDIVQRNFNLVVHMFSHTDWDRHRNIMKEIIQMTEAHGLDVWVDNWGLGGPPGDKAHFLGYSPESRQVYSNGVVDPVRACLNSPEFRSFTKEWIDTVYEIGGRSIFWDEPHLPSTIVNNKPEVWSCFCSRCKAIFEDRYNKAMPSMFTPEVEQFRIWSIVNYFSEMTKYSKGKGMENIVCVMLSAQFGIHLSTIGEIAGLEHLDNIGSDPYWLGEPEGTNPYDFVYQATKYNLEICEKYGKDHNIWIQGYSTPAGREEEIIAATDAAYDAGARTILVWGYRASESNDYRAVNTDLTWHITGEAMRRITDRHFDEMRKQNLERLLKGQ